MTAEPAPGPTDLAALRRRLEHLDGLPLEDRPEVFERLNEALVAELSRLEEV